MVARVSSVFVVAGLVLLAPTDVLAQSVPDDIPEMTLRIADTFPPVGFVPTEQKAWAERITERTGGKVKFQFFWSDSLFKQADAATNLAAGVADGARVSSTYDPAKTQLWMTLDMPYNAEDYWCGMTSSVKVEQEEPNLSKTFQELGFLPVLGYSSGHFQFLANEPIATIDDLKGKRLRSYGGARVKMYELVGMSPIFMSYAQIYEAVERGVIDGAEATILLTVSFKHHEVAKYMTIANTGFVLASPISLSLRTWNGFPDSLKQIFIEEGLKHDQDYARKMMEQEVVALNVFREKHGMTILELSPADQAAMEKAGRQAQELWLKEMEQKGVPARATWSEFRRLYEACEQDVAAKGYPWAR